MAKTVPKGLVPFRKGHDPRRGRGPAKGHGGRPTLAYRQWLESQEPEARAQFEQFLREGNPDMRFKAAIDVFDRIYGKSNQPITVRDLSGLIALARQDAS